MTSTRRGLPLLGTRGDRKMSRTRRLVLLLGLTVAVIMGATIPASASFAESVAVPRTTLTTGTVAAPSSVTANGYCYTTTSGYLNSLGQWVTTYSYWYTATLTWPASTTARGVTGYRVIAHLNDGSSYAMGETNAATRTMSGTVDRGYLGYQPTLSVVTLTSYGWTAESAPTAVLTC